MALQDSLDQLRSIDLGSLDASNIGGWPGPIKVILLVILFLVVLGAGYYLHIADKQTDLERSQSQEVDLRKEYEDKSAQAANLEALREQKAEMEATFGALLRQLPSDTEVPGLIEDITRTAVDNELTIESIDLQTENKTEFYIELPIEITVEGTYHKIGSFVSAVAALPRIVTLHDFKIAPTKEGSLLKMKITAKTYRYLEEAS